MNRFVLSIVAALAVFSAAAQVPRDQYLTFDLAYARIGLENNGWGLGAAYERKLVDHLSVKGGFGHMTFRTSVDDLYCTTVDVSLLANWYLLSPDLEKLYLGFGCSTDFLNYFGSAAVPEREEDSIIYLDSIIGWKAVPLDWLMLDLNVGYNLMISGAENYPGFQKYAKGGLNIGATLKILFP